MNTETKIGAFGSAVGVFEWFAGMIDAMTLVVGLLIIWSVVGAYIWKTRH